MNRLHPGALPLEWSFSELDPDALRIELQPFDPELAPEERLRCATVELQTLVADYYGEALAAQFGTDAQVEIIEQHSHLTFGAFAGFVLRPHCTPEIKIYVELDPVAKAKLRSDVSSIAGIAPHFRSIAAGAGMISERVYFLCRRGLRLLDLETLCAALGMRHRFPALLVTMLELTDGEFYLPPRSVLLGIRWTTATTELKVELISDLALNPEGLVGRVERLLAPTAVTPFRRWLEIVRPDAPRELLMSVVSVRVTATQAPRLSVYAAEPRSEP